MEEQDEVIAASSQQTKEKGVATNNGESPMTKKVDIARGAGPQHGDAAGFHLMNIVVHATTCSASMWLFRAVFAGKNNMDFSSDENFEDAKCTTLKPTHKTSNFNTRGPNIVPQLSTCAYPSSMSTLFHFPTQQTYLFLSPSLALRCACLVTFNSGEELPAVAASLLFTVHPVHVEV